MKKAILYVFSGTGNTRIAGHMIAKALRECGYQSSVFEVTLPYSNVPDPNDFDLVGLGYPIHAFNSPQIFRNFVRQLPPLRRPAPVFFFKTSGEPFALNNASSYLLYKEVRKKNFLPVQEVHLLMPYNIVFRYDDSLAKQMYLYTQAMSQALANRLAAGEQQKLHYTLRHRALSAALRIQWLGAKWNGRVYHIKKKRCNQCRRCLRECPSGNIYLKDGEIKFDHACAMCMRCVMYCPQDAITPGMLALWKVNGKYDFDALVADESLPCDFVCDQTTGYFASFNKYYNRVDADLAAQGIPSPRAAAAKAKE